MNALSTVSQMAGACGLVDRVHSKRGGPGQRRACLLECWRGCPALIHRHIASVSKTVRDVLLLPNTSTMARLNASVYDDVLLHNNHASVKVRLVGRIVLLGIVGCTA